MGVLGHFAHRRQRLRIKALSADPMSTYIPGSTSRSFNNDSCLGVFDADQPYPMAIEEPAVNPRNNMHGNGHVAPLGKQSVPPRLKNCPWPPVNFSFHSNYLRRW